MQSNSKVSYFVSGVISSAHTAGSQPFYKSCEQKVLTSHGHAPHGYQTLRLRTYCVGAVHVLLGEAHDHCPLNLTLSTKTDPVPWDVESL